MTVCTVCFNEKDVSTQSYSLGQGDVPLGDGRLFQVKVCKGCHYNLRRSIQIIRTLGYSQLEMEIGSESESPPTPQEDTETPTTAAPGGRTQKKT